jgi:Ca2+-binding RTX toxin-like protein
VKSALTRLVNIEDEDITVSHANATTWVITFANQESGLNQSDITASNNNLVGGNVSATIVQGVQGFNVHTNIQKAELVGTTADDRLDASAFTGPVTLRGGAGDDVLIGGLGQDVIAGGDGDDIEIQ